MCGGQSGVIRRRRPQAATCRLPKCPNPLPPRRATACTRAGGAHLDHPALQELRSHGQVDGVAAGVGVEGAGVLEVVAQDGDSPRTGHELTTAGWREVEGWGRGRGGGGGGGRRQAAAAEAAARRVTARRRRSQAGSCPGGAGLHRRHPGPFPISPQLWESHERGVIGSAEPPSQAACKTMLLTSRPA